MNNILQHLCSNDSHVLRVEQKQMMAILEVTNQQWNCVPLRIAKHSMIQRRILANLDREMYHRKLILVTKTYNKRMYRHIECVDIHGVHAEKV